MDAQEIYFDHEKLDVYRESIDFIAWVTPLLEKTGGLRETLDDVEPRPHGRGAGGRGIIRIRTRTSEVAVIRIVLPQHLQVLSGAPREVNVDVTGEATQKSVLDALEAKYPTLRGAIREHGTLKRRPMVRFFACEEDVSHEPSDAPLPQKVASGEEPFYIIGAIAGGC